MLTLGELSRQLGLGLHGDAGTRISALAPLGAAGPGDLAFVASRRHLRGLRDTAASALIIRPEWLALCPVPCLLSDDPYLSYARVTRLFDNRPPVSPGVHPQALVHPDCELGEQVSIGPHAVVEAGAVLGDRVVIGAGAVIGAGVRIGRGTHIYPRVVIYHGVTIGEHCVVHAGSVLGADGFGYARGPQGWEKILQLGGLQLGDRVEIGACTSIDRGALADTVIESGVIIDNQVQVAHNCRIGKNTAIAGCTGIAGSTTIGADCTLAGAVGVSGHLEIADGVHLSGQARVTRSIEHAGSYSSGTPLQTTRDWARSAVRFTQLEQLQRRVQALEAALASAGMVPDLQRGEAPAGAPLDNNASRDDDASRENRESQRS